MDWQGRIAEALRRSGVDLVAYVPDEVTGKLLELLEADRGVTMVSVTREEEGVAVLAGGYLGGKKGALILQGSGLGNAINALASLAVASQIPLLLLISERGRLGEFNPAQVPLGRATPRVLEALGIQAVTIDAPDEVDYAVEAGARLAFSSSTPVALLLSPKLTGGKHLR
jgi:sulfopyruvate decarboxylase alpha subunit